LLGLVASQNLMATRAEAPRALTQPVSDEVAVIGSYRLKLPAGTWPEKKQIDRQQVRVNGGGWEATPNSRSRPLQPHQPPHMGGGRGGERAQIVAALQH
jgi:hypothetical protein